VYKIVAIAGSPSTTSRSSAVLDYAKAVLEANNAEVHSVTVRDVPAEDLVAGNFESVALKQIQLVIEQADAVVVGTPVYKATYTGVLKSLLDLMPQYALKNKIVLPIATGGTIAHLLSLDYAIKPLFSVMGATQILQGVYILDPQIQRTDTGSIQLTDEIEGRLKDALSELLAALQSKPILQSSVTVSSI
jgi:FMN reductase